MCGIFATTSPDRWQSKVESILRLLSHRGPDFKSWENIDSSALMAHTRLEVIGLGAVGAQPARSCDESLVVVFNGEIYNYRELIQGGGPPTSDTQVLATLLTKRGGSSLSGLRGMYAFAAFDRRDGSLVAMRDPFGIKPLYLLRHEDGEVSISSEIAPLLLCPEAREVDAIGLAHFLSFGHTSNTNTLYSRIRKLDPGCLYRWSRDPAGKLNLKLEQIVPDASSSMTLKEALEDSISAHLTADVEVGAFLSGGVDSTLLCVLAKELGHQLRTYTLSMPDARAHCESAIAARNAHELGLANIEVAAHNSAMANAADEVVRIHGEPLGDAAVLPLSILAERAAMDLKVVLTGEGADEIFGGYGRYRVSRRLGKLSRSFGVVAHPIAVAWARRRDDRPMSRAVEAFCSGGGFPSHSALLGGEMEVLSRLMPDVYRDLIPLMKAEWQRVTQGSDLTTAIAYDRTCWLPNTYLEKADRATMLHGLEARVPYLDPVVSAVAERGEMHLHGKSDPRHLLTSLFPNVELPERKRGLSVDLRSLLREPRLSRSLNFELHDASSICGRLVFRQQQPLLAERCQRSATFAFRVAMLGVWEEIHQMAVV